MRILVCGGRDYNDRKAVFKALDFMHAQYPITLIIHGDAKGADSLAGEWAKERGIECKPFPADWTRYKNAAGPIRNTQMLAEGKPQGVLAFPGGNGTADMIKKSIKAGLLVWSPYGQ